MDSIQLSSEEIKKLSVQEVLRRLSSSQEKGLSNLEAQKRQNSEGLNTIVEEKESLLLNFLKFFWGPIPWMIEIAAVLSLVAKDWGDFAIISIMLIFNGLIGFFEEFKAANALTALKAGLALKARVKRDQAWLETPAAQIVPGDIIRIRLGDIIPADCKLIAGNYISIDQSALTGESLPVNKKIGDSAFSGSVAKQGEMVAVVTSTGSNTFFGRTAKLVESAGSISHFQKAVLKIGNFLIALSIALSIVLIVVVLIRDKSAGSISLNSIIDLAKFILILSIASIPVAMPAVLSVTMALGALTLSKHKAIVSKLQAIEEIAGVDILCSDKTGTLTKNELSLSEPVLFGTNSNEEIILTAALASKEENNDAIDFAIIAGVENKDKLKLFVVEKFIPFDPISKKTQSLVKSKSGETFYCTKGAPQVIIDLAVDDKKIADSAIEKVNELAKRGYRALGVAKSKDGINWSFLGLIPMFDPPRDDSKKTIAEAMQYGLSVKMVTGDDTAIAAEVSGQLGLGTHIQPADLIFTNQSSAHIAEQIETAEGFSRVFPEHKFAIVDALQKSNHIVAMTGDGVNDAPALKQSDAGFAVSGATDAARAAADIILTAPGLSVIINAIVISRKIFERMMSYTIYRIAMTMDVMFFVVLAIVFFPVIGGESFRPLSAAMIIILALLDDIPIMTIAYDNADVNPKPVRWEMSKILTVSCVLGFLAIVETFTMLFFAIQHHNLPVFGVTLNAGHIQTMMFLQLIVGGHLMLFVTRTKKTIFFKPWPALPLFAAIVGTQIVAILMCGFGIGNIIPQLPWPLIGLVWLYNFCWMFLQDFAKLLTYRLLHHKASHQKAWLRRTSAKLNKI